MKAHLPFRSLSLGILFGILVIICHGRSSAVEGGIIENDFSSYDIIDTLLVVDSLAEDSKGQIRKRDLESNPSCLYQDVYKHAVSTEPSVNVYGPFSAAGWTMSCPSIKRTAIIICSVFPDPIYSRRV